jgi:excisionase family DNA binding protein
VSGVVLIPLPGFGTLELPQDVFERFLVRPVVAHAEPSSAAQPHLVGAKVLAAELALPLSCVYELARSKRIPSIRVGKHVRFDRAAVRAAIELATGKGPVLPSQTVDRRTAATGVLPRKAGDKHATRATN